MKLRSTLIATILHTHFIHNTHKSILLEQRHVSPQVVAGVRRLEVRPTGKIVEKLFRAMSGHLTQIIVSRSAAQVLLSSRALFQSRDSIFFSLA